MKPAIIITSPSQGDVLMHEFARYANDYDVHRTETFEEALEVSEEIRVEGGDVAMYVAESTLPDGQTLKAFHSLRSVVATARRLVVAPWSTFRADSERLRPYLAKGKFDALLLVPRGERDEEFHTAVCELLSDWNSTVAAPVVESVRVISPVRDRLTAEIARPVRTGWVCRTAATHPTARWAGT